MDHVSLQQAVIAPGDLNDDGSIGTPDLLQFLSVFGYSCE
jgi:hypothetical protein